MGGKRPLRPGHSSLWSAHSSWGCRYSCPTQNRIQFRTSFKLGRTPGRKLTKVAGSFTLVRFMNLCGGVRNGSGRHGQEEKEVEVGTEECAPNGAPCHH